MSSIFSKYNLEEKPSPEIKETVEIKVPVPEKAQKIKIQTKVNDRRKEGVDKQGKKFDRSSIAQRIQGIKDSAPVIKPPSSFLTADRTVNPESAAISSVMETLESEKLPTPAEDTTAPKKSKKPPMKIKIATDKPVAAPPEESQISSSKKIGKLKLRPAKQIAIKKGTISQTASIASIAKPRTTKAPDFSKPSFDPASTVQLGPDIIASRLPKPQPNVLLTSSTYYMNNREAFTNFINRLLQPYAKELEELEGTVTCETRSSQQFGLLTNQKIVRDYINMFTPYRGLLLYHGLGAGKTCASIAIAEGMKSQQQILVMTPASLRMNYIEELKKCGDELYKKNQFWEFVQVGNNPELLKLLSDTLLISIDYIRKQGGAWMVDVKQPSNFESLDQEQKQSLDAQLDQMISHKYQFISYNGLRFSHLEKLTQRVDSDGSSVTVNPFSNRVVIIDEAHNFISRIVNKLNKPESLAMRLYEFLMSAENCRVILLSGTPIINYPNEIAILYNILRGYITTWTLKLNITTSKKYNNENMTKLLHGSKYIDYIDYKPGNSTLVITRNPFAFVDKADAKGNYAGVKHKDMAYVNDTKFNNDFIASITKLLNKNGIEVESNARVDLHKALPDSLDDFKSFFIDEKTDDLKNKDMFQRRILGLTSYYRSAQEQLMPEYKPDQGDFQIEYIEMSNYQFGVYEEARSKERSLDKRNAQKRKKNAGKEGLFDDTVSTYRIFSRAFCNFVFPREIPRPMPGQGAEQDIQTAMDEIEKIQGLSESGAEVANLLEVGSPKDAMEGDEEGAFDTIVEELQDANKVLAEALEDPSAVAYEKKLQDTLIKLKEESATFLNPTALKTYSPKFLSMLENIQDPEHIGLHMIYSQFRTLEGIGVLKLILEANGFAEFKLSKTTAGLWSINIAQEDIAKPKFALYTGTETVEEKELVRNIFNNSWEYLPPNLVTQIKELGDDNITGSVIKIIMITAAGAEGINLKNVRYVHITEPYWHPVRVQQAIGRARRICSHEELPPDLRNIKVILYLMKFSQEQTDSDANIELRLQDKSRFNPSQVITSDQFLYEISKAKEEIIDQILKSVKESSIDCQIHSKSNASESLVCFSFGSTNTNLYSYKPSITGEESDSVARRNKREVKWKAQEIRIDGTKFALRKDTDQLYDFDSYQKAVATKEGDPIFIGKVVRNTDGDIIDIE